MRTARLLAAVLLVGGACHADGRSALRGGSATGDQTSRTTLPGPADGTSPPTSAAVAGPAPAPQQGRSVAGGPRATTTTTRGQPSTTTTSTPPPTAPQGSCPNPKTCPTYTLYPGVSHGWRPGPDGVSRIPWYLDPTVPPNSSLTSDQIRRAMVAAIAVWEAADPSVKFDYQGDWTGVSYQGDGRNVFAYGGGVTTSSSGGYIVEADIPRYPQTSSDAWHPCEQRDGSCTDTDQPTGDLQDLLTHELGHTLGLGDLPDKPETHWLTMQHVPQPGERFRNTLALGDVLGLRHLYPTAAPMPVIYDP